MTPYELIEDVAGVEALARDLRREPVIAIDTEADSFFHYHDKLCLLQIGSSRGNFIVDPLASGISLDSLVPVFADPKVRKVLHAAEYDLYVLQRSGGIRIRNLFDTMVSAQLLGYPAVGLAALVARHFQVQLSKDQQRTDWSKRPLRQAQLEYAASDVAYLIELVRILEGELQSKGRLEWAKREFAALEERVWPEREFDPEGYLKIKGARKLSLRSLAVLRELFLMRNERAKEYDKPPFKILGNGTLFDLAVKPPTSKRALQRRKGVTDLVLRRYGDDVIGAVERGMNGPEHPPLERRGGNGVRRRLDRRAEQALERLKQWRGRRASELNMDPGVFCPNAALEEIAIAGPATRAALDKLENVRGWWAENFGAELLELLAQARSDAEPEEARSEASDARPAGDAAAAPRSRRRSRRRRKRGARNTASS
jgi:ribonuclease D